MLDVTKLQPVNTFYEVEIGGLKNIYHYPQHPLSLRVELDVGQSGLVNFQLFDDTGFIVEFHLWASGGKAKLRWGYFHEGREISSPVYDVQLINYKVIVGRNSFTFDVHGSLTGEHLWESNSYSGTFHEVVEEFAEHYGYKVEYTPPVSKQYLRGIDPSGETTLVKDWEFRKPAHLPDGRWISEVVRQYARSEEGKGSYDLVFTQDEDGNKLMRIVLSDSVDNRWKFVVQDVDTNVVDWQPEIDVALSAGFGNQEIISQGINEITGNLTKIVANYENIKPFIPKIAGGGGEAFKSQVPIREGADVVYRNSENMPASVTNQGVRVRSNASINEYLDLNPVISNVALERVQSTIQGSLVLLGDPEIAAGFRCHIQFHYPSSLRYVSAGIRPPLHYSTGDYYIGKAVHDIKLGSYLTTLEVSRDSVLATPEGGSSE